MNVENQLQTMELYTDNVLVPLKWNDAEIHWNSYQIQTQLYAASYIRTLTGTLASILSPQNDWQHKDLAFGEKLAKIRYELTLRVIHALIRP